MKSLTNLEFNKGGNKFNSIVSRETLGETKQISEFYEENGTAKYIVGGEVKEIGNGDKQTLYAIKSTKWEPITNTGSYKFKVTLKLPFEVGELDIVMLANTNTLLFEKFGISAMNLGVDSVDIICRKQPTEDINVKLIFSKAKVLDAPIEPTSATQFTFDGTSCTGYVGDQNAPQIVIPRSYSKKTRLVPVVGAKVTDTYMLSYELRDFTSVSFSDGQSFQRTYNTPDELRDLEYEFHHGDCYMTNFNGNTFWLIRSGSFLEYPIVINGQTFNDAQSAFEYVNNNMITEINFAGDITKDTYFDGNDYQVDKVGATNGASGFINYNGSIILLDNITSIDDNAFNNCTILTTIVIPKNVTSIGISAFDGCTRLMSITIPNKATNIKVDAFYNCTALNDITYKGTKQQWNAITKGRDWNYQVPAQVVHCTDGDAPIGGV